MKYRFVQFAPEPTLPPTVVLGALAEVDGQVRFEAAKLPGPSCILGGKSTKEVAEEIQHHLAEVARTGLSRHESLEPSVVLGPERELSGVRALETLREWLKATGGAERSSLKRMGRRYFSQRPKDVADHVKHDFGPKPQFREVLPSRLAPTVKHYALGSGTLVLLESLISRTQIVTDMREALGALDYYKQVERDLIERLEVDRVLRAVFTIGPMSEHDPRDLRKEMTEVRGGEVFDTTHPDQAEQLDEAVLSVAA